MDANWICAKAMNIILNVHVVIWKWGVFFVFASVDRDGCLDATHEELLKITFENFRFFHVNNILVALR